jgi:predicted TIM-barrel fold metal-dependent hydrolase
MNDRKCGRRDFLREGLAALASVGLIPAVAAEEQVVVPNSAGVEPPKMKAPALACDCHHHIYDTARFPPLQKAVADARVAEYRLFQRRIGTARNVVVTPSAYGTDNRVTVDAITQFGRNTRGIAVVHPTVTDVELKTLYASGIRGIRFSVSGSPSPNGNRAVTTIDMIEPLSKRVNALGWHVQIQMDADQIAAAEDLWNRLPSVIVFDHMGHIPQPMGIKHPAFNVIRRMVDKGRTWVKLSVTYDNTKDGPPTYADVSKVAQAYVQAAPERLVWGSNWPHPNDTQKPNDAVLFDLLTTWAPNEAVRHRILVDNPEVLYGFGKVA